MEREAGRYSNPSRASSASTSSTLFSLSGDDTLFANDFEDATFHIKFPTFSTSKAINSFPFSDTSSILTVPSSATKSIVSLTKPWFPRGVLGRIVMGFGSSAVDLVSEYALKKKLNIISSRADLKVDGHCTLLDAEIRELEELYQDLLYRDYRGDKLQILALKLRLSIIRLLLNVDTPRLFSRMQKDAFQKIWQDLDQQKLLADYEGSSVLAQARELKQALLLKAADEICSKQLSSPDMSVDADGKTFLDEATVIEVLCKELAYCSGDYAIQNALERIVNTKHGFQHFVELTTKVDRESGESGKLIFDCLARLLNFDNVFSCAMAFRIFGKLAQQNQDIHDILAGVKGVGWLVERLSELTFTRIYTKQRWRGRSVRAVESYCSALLVACVHGFTDQVVKLGIVVLLFRLIKIFTIRDRDPKVCSQMEENQHEDLDVERDQIACCELILYLLDNPSAKKKILCRARLMRTFNAHSNRLLSDQKLLSTLAIITKQLKRAEEKQ